LIRFELLSDNLACPKCALGLSGRFNSTQLKSRWQFKLVFLASCYREKHKGHPKASPFLGWLRFPATVPHTLTPIYVTRMDIPTPRHPLPQTYLLIHSQCSFTPWPPLTVTLISSLIALSIHSHAFLQIEAWTLPSVRLHVGGPNPAQPTVRLHQCWQLKMNLSSFLPSFLPPSLPPFLPSSLSLSLFLFSLSLSFSFLFIYLNFKGLEFELRPHAY
jgi:hypothetical protein